ncbi:MAG: response regulator [Candidatus Acidiferrales bacterium]
MPRILVADDNSNIQKMVVLAFEERGVDVVTVGNGEAAVRRLPDVNPDLVLADVFMPVRNGYEVCEFIKKDTRYAHIPVILLVGAFDPLDEKEARRVGADGVLKKPFVPPDPLIAMVMSVLEKNPRIAAELAKQKEIIPEPPAPVEVMEAPLRSEPKPLPEFPEPTPEEAAAIYGFGKGVRALAGDETEEEEDEEQEGKRSKKSKGSKPAKSLKSPVAKDKEPEADDDFATVSDWRRNAADFDVPENIAQDAHDSFGSDLDTSAFPSEKDVPPKHIRNSEESDAQESEAQEISAAPVNEVANDVAGPAGDANDLAAPVNETLEVQTAAVEEPSEPVFASSSVADEAPQTSHALWIPASTPDQTPAASSEPKEEVRAEAEPAARPEPVPSIAARHTEWMDMMAPPPSEYPSGGWMSNLGAPSPESAPSHAEPEAAQAESRSQASSDHREGIAEPAGHAEEISEQETEHGHGSKFGSHFDSDDRFFNNAAEPARPSYHFTSETHEADDAAEHVAEETASAPVASTSADFDHQLMVAPADAERPDQDASSHPTPEPLLVDESHSQNSDYSPHQEESSPTQHILPPAADEQNAQPDSNLEQLEPSVFEPAAQEPAVEEFSERIPTLPPPNREALSGIAFLMPPRVQVDATPNEPSTEAVDALVRKVLEKLQPQLQEMFSQGVKPLVENLVHSELSKKDR